MDETPEHQEQIYLPIMDPPRRGKTVQCPERKRLAFGFSLRPTSIGMRLDSSERASGQDLAWPTAWQLAELEL